MVNLNHKNILKYLGHELINKNLYIYLEYMDVGNLSGLIKKYGFLEEDTIKIYVR